VSDKVHHVSRGRIRIGGSIEDLATSPRGADPTSHMMDGTEDIDDGVELEER